MQSLLDVFKMRELSKATRCGTIIALAQAINYQYGANLTEAVVCELIEAIDPTHPILKNDDFLKRVDKLRKTT